MSLLTNVKGEQTGFVRVGMRGKNLYLQFFGIVFRGFEMTLKRASFKLHSSLINNTIVVWHFMAPGGVS